MVKRFDVMRPRKYVVNGAEKTQWLPVGKIVQFEDGGLSLELNHTSEKFMVFAEKPKMPQNSQNGLGTVNSATQPPNTPQKANSGLVEGTGEVSDGTILYGKAEHKEEINPSSIPF